MSYIGQNLPTDVFGGYTTDTFAGDGSATTFTLSQEPISEQGLIVVINNVIQKPTTNYTVSGTTLTIVGTAVASGDVIYARHTGVALPIGEASAVTEGTTIDLNGGSDKLILDADADTTISADTDDQIDFKAGGTDVMSMTATGLTINDGTTITTADNTDTLTLTSTDADANAGPNLRLYRNSSSPAPNDVIAVIESERRNDNSEDIIYQQYQHLIADETDGTEDGYFIFNQMRSGTLTERYRIETGTFCINEPGADFDFRIESDDNTHMFFVDASNNNILINNNTDRMSAELQVTGVQHNTRVATFTHTGDSSSAAPFGILVEYSGSAPDSNSDSANLAFRFFDSSASTRFLIAGDGDCLNHDNDFGAVSDERIKDNIVDASTQWDDIKALKVRKFERKDDIAQHGQGNNVQIGVIAQELEAAGMNGLVKQSDPMEEHIKMSSEFGELNEDGTIKSTTGEKVRSVKYSVLYMKAIKALQEAMAKIETLETKVKALEDA